MVVAGANHWWQNWPKTHGYVAQRMFFPSSVADIADAIRVAESDRLPLRAVGGGWSFSDAALPGLVTTNRPNIYAVEALAAVVPRAVTFPSDPRAPSVASIGPALPRNDVPGSLVMIDGGLKPPAVDARWSYLGGGQWMWVPDGRLYGSNTDPANFLEWLTQGATTRWWPIRQPGSVCLQESDTAGSLIMFDLKRDGARPDRDWFYNGHGVWTVGVAGDSPAIQGTMQDLSFNHRLTHDYRFTSPSQAMNLSPKAADAARSLSILLTPSAGDVPAAPEPVYLIDTRSIASSLQQELPSLLSPEAADLTSATPSDGRPQRHYFHVEAGITIAELGRLLSHQTPRLSLQAISGSPGATLAGALSTATHGAEFNWPLVVDTVLAVHLVGPGGVSWWIEGDRSVADVAKLRSARPDMRIVAGTEPVIGILPQDWLNAAIVSMGAMGVLYSVVLEVVPLFGVHEVVVEKSWGRTATSVATTPRLLFVGDEYKNLPLDGLLRDAATSAEVSRRLVSLLQAGELNGTGIRAKDEQGRLVNQYADLAINPNRRANGEYDCWIGNREVTESLPIDAQPPVGSETADMIAGITAAFAPEALVAKLKNIYGFGSDLDFIGNFLYYSSARSRLNRLLQAADLVDVALDTALTPMVGQPDGPEIAQVLLSGLLAGLLGTAKCDHRSDKSGLSVGALGFPAAGVMGTGLEVALSPSDAFGFLQTAILDHVNPQIPFFGYVSIRLCSKTDSLLGMQQFAPCTVSIEVVGYGTPDSRAFVAGIQQRTVERIEAGLNAMLHWGLENDLLQARHLRMIPALQEQTRSKMTKIDTFTAVRARLQSGAPTAYRVFDNAFTARLGLASSAPLELDVLSFLGPLLMSEPDARETDVSFLEPLLLSEPDAPTYTDLSFLEALLVPEEQVTTSAVSYLALLL